jgi:hypothetical protein
MKRAAFALFAVFAPLALFALTLASCSSQPSLTGAGEPLFVYGATFIAGPLPGSPPPDGGAPIAPDVTSIDSPNNVFLAGQGGWSFTGDVTDDATAVAVRFPDAGTGYWVFVPGSPDTSAPGMLGWSMTFDIGITAPLGLGALRFAALDATGAAGSQNDLPVCVATPYPDNLNVCQISIPPPAAVLSLAWDTPVDLDLELQTPSGVVVGPKHPSTSASGAVGPNDGVLDRDSDANCVPDQVNREDIVWKNTPEAGQYLVYADLFSACGQPAVQFTLTLYVAEPADGGSSLVQKLQIPGELLAIDANGGASMGLYLGAFTLPYP